MTTLLIQPKEASQSTLITPLLDPERTPSNNLKSLDKEIISLNINSGVPPVNVYETPGEYILELVAPGLNKKNLLIEVEDGILTISLEAEEETMDGIENYRRKEFIYSGFSRSFELPLDAFEEEIDSSYENGILTLLIPKKEEVLETDYTIIEID